jgi:predicted O-linked N-acetylglucosamine transferase (SPINDLY family)
VLNVKPGRNDPCPCGSGKKFKKCCENKIQTPQFNEQDAVMHNKLGNALQNIGQPENAIASYRRALEIKPTFAEAHNNLGIVLKNIGQLESSMASFRRALEINPNFAGAYSNMGNVQRELGLFDVAVASYRRAMELKPDYLTAHSNLLFTLNFVSNQSAEMMMAEAQGFGKMATRLARSFNNWPCVAENVQCLRVGLVSSDLRMHPVGFFLETVLANIDPTRIELFAYPTLLKEDELTARIRPFFKSWKPLRGLADETAARLIHDDGVHILLDLCGHTANNRLPVFAWKPAPIQASWLGYFATTGVAEMDYVLVDAVGVAENQRDQFTEAVWYLPDTRLCFTPPSDDLPVTALPALKNGLITFGCFQKLSKVGDEVLSAWGDIFAALPKARLRMQCQQLGEQEQEEQLLARLQRYGIAADRVELKSGTTRAAYLAAHAEVDMILDTFPFPGGTTTCEALWMGVPTLTLAGGRLLARQGASLLTAAGLPDWVTENREEYITKAIELAGDLPKLSTLRAGLRQQVLASPVFDGKRFALNLEQGVWGLWECYRDCQETLESLILQ